LAKLAPKRSGEQGEDLVLDLDLFFEVSTEQDAEAVGSTVPGALALWRTGQSAREAGGAEEVLGGAAARSAGSRGVYGGISIKVPDPDVRISLSMLGGEQVVEAVAEVSALRFKSTPKVSALVVRARLHGLDGEDVGSLATLLGETVEVVFERSQQSLPFERSAPTAEIGSVISGIQSGREYAGLVVGRAIDETEGEMIEIEDFDARLLVRATSVTGAIKVQTEGQTLDEALDAFRDLAAEAGLDPSWRYLVVALGHEYLSGSETPSLWCLTPEIVESALSVAKEVA
jgi:hypothetical protein